MKSINQYTIKNYAIIAGLVLVVPLTYAASQTVPIHADVATTSSSTADGLAKFAFEGDSILTNITNVKLSSTEEFDMVEKARKGKIESINEDKGIVTVSIGTAIINVQRTASTTFFTGTGNLINFNQLEEGMSLYVFGYLSKDQDSMNATKIVVANKSKLARSR